ncbi:MAG: TonB-dependent receptor [Calditrichia bacterium]
MRFLNIAIILPFILFNTLLLAQKSGSIRGTVSDKDSGEPLAGCEIYIKALQVGTVTDSLGRFELIVPIGEQLLQCQFIGYEPFEQPLSLTSRVPNARLFIVLQPAAVAGKSVTVFELHDGQEKIIASADIRKMPDPYSDPLRSIKILPGVASNNELSSAYNVRGGNFDENLIYLNGYEIYRPFLLRRGVEENQSLINPDLVENLKFYSGGFPVLFGDRLSSALEVDYGLAPENNTRMTVRADFLTMGAAVKHSGKTLQWSGGVRYANPQLFVNRLQTSGNYRPEFFDGQFFARLKLSKNSQLQLFALHARNRFDLTPDTFTGNFKFSLVDVRAVEIEYDGNSAYSFQSSLAGLAYGYHPSEQTSVRFSVAGYNTSEEEQVDLAGNIFYVLDASEPQSTREYLKSRVETADNLLDLETLEAHVTAEHTSGVHKIQAGINVRSISMKSRIDEAFFEEGGESTQEVPLVNRDRRSERVDYFSGYLQDSYSFSKRLQATAGLRVYHYSLNNETRVSPRSSISFKPSEDKVLRLSGGIYEQPPLFYELQGVQREAFDGFNSQQSIHGILGWEQLFKERLSFQAEVFYKKLNRIIPYYVDELKLIYRPEERTDGFAYGMDISIRGEIVEGLNSWISYSYLNTQERDLKTGINRRRILDQTHTARIFLQDKVPNYPNIQAHLRLLYGSGYLFHPRSVVDQNGQNVLAVDFARLERFSRYTRADLGMTGRFTIGDDRALVISAEVLNVFNNINVAGYSWFQIFPGDPVRIPRVYTRRFFNLGFELSI